MQDRTFDEIIGREFLDPLTAEDIISDVYGIRFLFYREADPSDHITLLMPWLTYSRELAENMRHAVVIHRPELMMLALGRFYRSIGRDVSEVTLWVPLGCRVVRLAEIPF